MAGRMAATSGNGSLEEKLLRSAARTVDEMVREGGSLGIKALDRYGHGNFAIYLNRAEPL